MRLHVFNGSPRGLKSNTRLMVDQMCAGISATGAHEVGVTYLLREHKPQEWLRLTRQAEVVLLAFPLYADAMPGVVKEYLEALVPLRQDGYKPTFIFLVQSGFPEAVHSRSVARYLEKLCRRLGAPHGGTLVRGGVEGIQVMPPWMTRTLYRLCVDAGEELGATGTLSPDLCRRFAGRERYGAVGRGVLRVLKVMGVTDMYWKQQMKQHGVLERSRARPLQEDDSV
jgi:hypothetical protein